MFSPARLLAHLCENSCNAMNYFLWKLQLLCLLGLQELFESAFNVFVLVGILSGITCPGFQMTAVNTQIHSSLLLHSSSCCGVTETS